MSDDYSEDDPIYADRNIGTTPVQTAHLVQALIGNGPLCDGLGNYIPLFGARVMAALILKDHPALAADDAPDPREVFRAVRDAGYLAQSVNRKDDAVSDEELSASVDLTARSFALCRQMARTILAWHGTN